MSTRENKDWRDDPRLTAHAFGELEGAELEALRVEIEGDVEAAAVLEELRAMGAVLQAELAAEAASEGAPALTSAQRERIATGAEPRRSAWRPTLGQWVGLAASGVAVLGAAIYFKAPDGAVSIDAAMDSGIELAQASQAPAASRPAPTAPAPMERRFSRSLQDLGYTAGEVVAEEEPLEEPELLSEATRSMEFGAAQDEDDAPVTLQDDEDAAEAPSREQYARIQENPFLLTSSAPLSTFSIDVDTASYSNVRRMLNAGELPNPDAVRIEELVNYFPYHYPSASSSAPFSVHVEIGGAPWAPTHRLVRIGLKGRETHVLERTPANLVFLLDVSGSMDSPDKLPLLKKALTLAVQNLDDHDRVAIVVYAGASGLVLPSTTCDQSVSIQMALEQLDAGGSTNGGAGIELAYEVAGQNFIEGGINRVLLATDGDFNVGVTDDGSLTRLIEEKAGSGVFLTVLGFGTGNLQDAKMEQLADKGNGNYAYIDSMLEARKVLALQLGGTLETIAKDVKIQVEFNPLEVQAYRLLGYENRMLAAQDFNDDTKDAGEIGAGHTVTALYELVPVGAALDVPGIDPLKYQTPTRPAGAAYSGELMNLKLRYKEPAGDTSKLLEFPIVDGGGNFAELGDDSRFAAAVAAFGMLLRDSRYKGEASYRLVSAWAADSLGDDPGGYRAQFLELVEQARELSHKGPKVR